MIFSLIDRINQRLKKHLDVILLFCFCVITFTFLIKNVSTDIQAHIRHVLRINNGSKEYPVNFLFYYLVNLLSGFSSHKQLMYFIAIIILSMSTTAKYIISKNIINSISFKLITNEKLIIISFGLIFCFAIPDPFTLFVYKFMYFGKFVPIVWHNSTTILLFPFALLLFWKQLKLLNPESNATKAEILILNVLVVINIFIKPSFIFVYAPVTFFFLLKRFKRDSFKQFLFNISPIITSVVLIIGQYYLIYIQEIGSYSSEQSTVSLAAYPFEILLYRVPIWFLPISFMLSFALPIYTIITIKSIMTYRPFVYALYLSLTGIFIFAFIKETGPRMYDANFYWQTVICTYLLFLTTILFLLPKFFSKSLRPKNRFYIAGLFTLHVLSGVLYLIKIGLMSSYS